MAGGVERPFRSALGDVPCYIGPETATLTEINIAAITEAVFN